MRSMRGEARQRCEAVRDELAALPIPHVEFYRPAGTAVREVGSSVFFALRGQGRWRQLAEQIAAIVGADPPPRDRLFHMSVWNSQNGDPCRSIGDVRVSDFPHAVE